jgi:hypothetical protein
MKVRIGFVSNSSSCSFTLLKTGLSEAQMNKVRNHDKFYKLIPGWERTHPWLGKPKCNVKWDIKEGEDFFQCFTCIDNFPLVEFLHEIGVPDENITNLVGS